MQTSQPSSPAHEPSLTAPELLGRLFPPLHRYWPNLYPKPDGSGGVSPPQAAFLLLDQREAFYGGAAGGGKSDAILAAALQYVDVPGYAALILRRTFPELIGSEGLLDRARSWLTATDAHPTEEGKLWTFPSGATLRFGHVETEADRFKYDGQAYQFVGFDEVTSFSETQYDWIGFSRARRKADLKALGIPTRTRATGTPTGVGYGWVKRRFISHRKDDVVFIPATVYDNPGLDVDDYAASLSRMPEETRKRLLLGDWDVLEGAAFPKFSEQTHIVPSFDPPAEWLRFESLDHGVANPTAVLAWACDYDGNLIIFDSYYSPGLVSEHAAAITAKRERWWPRDERGWLTQSVFCFADPSIFSRTGATTKAGEPASVATEYFEAGIGGIARATNDPKAGRLRLLELIEPRANRPYPSWHPRAGELGSPTLFIVGSRCPDLVEQLKAAPTNPEPVGQKHGVGEIVDPKTESKELHAVAAARYGALTWQGPPERSAPEIADPRARAVAEMVQRDHTLDLELAGVDEDDLALSL